MLDEKMPGEAINSFYSLLIDMLDEKMPGEAINSTVY
jgi:hypothetical protein